MRRIATLTGVILACVLLTACGDASSDVPVPAATPTAVATLRVDDLPPTATTVPAADVTATAAVVANGVEQPLPPPGEQSTTAVLTMGVNASFEPFLFKDESGNLAGVDIDLIQALGAVADFEVTFVDGNFQDVLDGVAEGRYDLGMAAITITPERSERMLFTDPYFTTDQAPVSFFAAGQSLVVPVDSNVNSVDDLTDESRVGVKSDTTGAGYAHANLRSQIEEYPEAEVLLAALVAGEVDAAILDSAVVADYILAHPDSLRLAGGPLVEEEYGIAVRPGDEALVEQLNAALTMLRENGAYDQIIAKWFAP